MKKYIYQIGLLTFAAACGLQAVGKPARQGLMTVPTADGSQLKVRLAGDEFFHQYFTEDGYPLIEKDGSFYYCDYDANGDVVSSGIKAGAVSARGAAARSFLAGVDKGSLEQRIQKRASRAPRRASAVSQPVPAVRKAPAAAADDNDAPPFERGYGLFPDLRFPAYGDQKAIVILVEYTDVKFSTSYDAKDYFTRMLNEDGFADYGGTGSAAQYFRENSGGHFRPEFDVYGPITLSHNQAYYGGNDWYGNDQHPEEMIIEACAALDDIVDFSDYDRNGDGVVDNIFVFYAGRGEASGGSASTVWPHSWNMTSAGHPDLYYDGVRVHTYGCSNEWESGRPDGVGTFVHEFSHVIGLPDLYATSYTGAFTPGSWSALDYGPYNNDGMTPPNYGAFERYALGWLKPREIDRELTATLQPVSENVCGIIRTAKDTEFFLVENRQQEGWDTYIPGHGMLIWHVDYNGYIWSSNTVNNSSSHQYVDIEEADNSQSEYSRDGDSFPGYSNKTSFTAQTSPAMKTWNGNAVNFPITGITESDGIITFNVLGGSDVQIEPINTLEATDVTAESFTLNWESPAQGCDAILNLYTKDAEGNAEHVAGYRNRNMGSATSVAVAGLQPMTAYYYTVAHSSGWQVSEPSAEREVFTGKRTIEYSAVSALEASDIVAEGFTANWLPLDDATEYLLTVNSLVPGDPFYATNGFDDGVDNLHGWDTNTTMTYAMESYCGQAAPSLRMSNGKTLTSPVYDDFIRTLSFWHRGNNTTTGDLINVYARTADDMALLETVEVEKTAGGVITEVTGFPEGTLQVVLEFDRKGDKGSLAIDDVTVGHGMTYTRVPVEGYNDVSVGNVLAFAVEGLQPQSPYSYTVRATDGTLFSKVSGEVMVRTGEPVGIDNVTAPGFALGVNGLVVTATTGDQIIVADYTGALVARGAHKVTLPRAGLYIVSVPAQNYVKKIIAR